MLVFGYLIEVPFIKRSFLLFSTQRKRSFLVNMRAELLSLSTLRLLCKVLGLVELGLK